MENKKFELNEELLDGVTGGTDSSTPYNLNELGKTHIAIALQELTENDTEAE